MITSVMGGRIFFEVMRPRTKVKFSSHVLLDTSALDAGKPACLTFSMVRDSNTELRDAAVKVQARFWDVSPDGSMTGKRVSLALKSDYFNILEQWQISHVLDEHSPLWHLRDDLRNKLTGIEVSLVAFDTSYMQEVRLYASYSAADLALHASFTPMVRMVEDEAGGGSSLLIDYSKLSEYAHTQSFTSKVRRSVVALRGLRGRLNADGKNRAVQFRSLASLVRATQDKASTRPTVDGASNARDGDAEAAADPPAPPEQNAL